MADDRFLRAMGVNPVTPEEDQHAECYRRYLEERDGRVRAEQANQDLRASYADSLADEWRRGVIASRWLILAAAVLAWFIARHV